MVSDFKETEIGPIPVDWEVVPLREVTEKKQTRDPRKTPDETFRYIDVSSVSNESYRVQGWKEYQGHEAPSRARKVVKARDTLFATVRPYLRNIAQVPSHLDNEICSTGFCVIRAKSGKVDPDYLYFVALTDSFVARVVAQQRGSSYPAVSDKVVLSELVPLPPLPEQRRIAHVLSTIQRAIAAQDDLIGAAREVKRSLMQRLFTYGPVTQRRRDAEAQSVETKMTEIGEIPEHWEVVELGDVVDVKGGKRLPRGHKFADSSTDHPYIRVVDFNNDSVDRMDLRFVTPEDYERIKRYTISSEDVYISIAGTTGLVGTVPEDLDGANLTENAAKLVIRDKNRLLKPFLVYALASERGQAEISQRTTKTSQPKLALMRIRKIPIPFPLPAEQRQIADMLSAVGHKIAAEEQRKAALQALFKTMLHQLMTGQIRINAETRRRRGSPRISASLPLCASALKQEIPCTRTRSAKSSWMLPSKSTAPSAGRVCSKASTKKRWPGSCGSVA